MKTLVSVKKIGTVFTAIALTLAIMLSIANVSVSAANVCKSVSGTSNTKNVVTFSIKTDKKWTTRNYITFTSQKGTAAKWTANSRGETTNHSIYGVYRITVTDNKTRKATTYTMKSGTLKIKGLRGNATFTVKVEPLGGNNLAWQGTFGSFAQWITYGKWSISKTSGITLCR